VVTIVSEHKLATIELFRKHNLIGYDSLRFYCFPIDFWYVKKVVSYVYKTFNLRKHSPPCRFLLLLSFGFFFWTLLLGNRTRELNADKVSVSSSADIIAQFRDAVKAKHSNKLSSFDAADLLVYKNKAAFDKRNAEVDEGKEELLEEDSSINDLGASKKEKSRIPEENGDGRTSMKSSKKTLKLPG
jgi:hypothetical protein